MKHFFAASLMLVEKCKYVEFFIIAWAVHSIVIYHCKIPIVLPTFLYALLVFFVLYNTITYVSLLSGLLPVRIGFLSIF